jgi:hypothetical protein
MQFILQEHAGWRSHLETKGYTLNIECQVTFTAVSMYIYIYTRTHREGIYIYTHTHTHIHRRSGASHIRIYVCVYVGNYVYICTHI